MMRNIRETRIRYLLVAMLLSSWIIIASCDDGSLEGPPNELITNLTFTPGMVVQGESIELEMLIWNNTKEEIVLDCNYCCWAVRLYTADMRELVIFWPCPDVTCLPLSYEPGEQVRHSYKFATLVADDSWPSDNGCLPVGKYIVRAGYGDLSSSHNPCPSAQGVFWVIEKD